MRLENSFAVPAPPEQAWALLLDVPRIIPCMPGARLDEAVDGERWRATVDVKLGPIALAFKTEVTLEEADEDARRAKLSATAREARGRGNASATVESTLTPHDGGTRVDIVTELQLAGAVAQYGRGLVQGVASQLVAQFAGRLAEQLASTPPKGTTDGEAAEAEPVDGVRVGLDAAHHSLRRRSPRRVLAVAALCVVATLVATRVLRGRRRG